MLKTMIRVLVADDHAIVRRGLAQIVSETMDMRVSAEAANGGEVIDVLRREPIDVVVLDLNMPGQAGLDTLKQIKVEFPTTAVLILSVHAEDQYAVRMLRAGASGYLSKETAPDQLVQAIRRVSEGGRYVTPATAEALLMQLDTPGPPHSLLSDREFQVLRMLAAGRSATDIADALSISIKTVSTYRARILGKMNMKSNADLTRYAIEHRLTI
jgi:two-component system, NarL family, invasion response regulator UvrY